MIDTEIQSTSQIGNEQRAQNKRRVNSESNVNSIPHLDESRDILLTVADEKNKDKTHRLATIKYAGIERLDATPKKSFKLKNSFNFDDEDVLREAKIEKDSKSGLLQRLREKNKTLKNQIYQIQRIQKQRTKRIQEKRQRSFDEVRYEFSTKDSLAKQLCNAYTKIRRYETEIKQVKRIDNRDQSKKISNLSQTLEQMELVKRQRSKNLEKIKRVNKKIEDKIEYYKKGQFQEKIKLLLREISYLKQKQKQMKASEDKRKEKLQKQRKFISKIENQLMQNGVAKQFIQDLRNRTIYGEQEKQRQENISRRITKREMLDQFKKSEHEGQIVRKLIKEQQKTLQQLVQKQRMAATAEKKTVLQLQQLDEEIKHIEQRIAQVRQNISSIHLKPKPIPPKDTTKEDQKIQQIQHLKEVRKRFFDRKKSKYLKKLNNQQKEKFQAPLSKDETNLNQNSPQTKFNGIGKQPIFEKYGQMDEKSVQFSDKNIFEQLSGQNCRITGICIYISQKAPIIGIKAEYNHKYQGLMHILANQTDHQEQQIYENDKNAVQIENIRENRFSCSQNEYIKQIRGRFSGDRKLISLELFTNEHKYHNFLAVEDQPDHEPKQDYQFTIPSQSDLYPIYIFGALSQKGICQFGVCSTKVNAEN